MPGKKEQGGSGGSGERKIRRPSYLDARRYQTPEDAGRVYFEAQEAIRKDQGRADLSVIRMMVGPDLQSHVVVYGDTPRKQLLEQLERTLEAVPKQHYDCEPASWTAAVGATA